MAHDDDDAKWKAYPHTVLQFCGRELARRGVRFAAVDGTAGDGPTWSRFVKHGVASSASSRASSPPRCPDPVRRRGVRHLVGVRGFIPWRPSGGTPPAAGAIKGD